MKYSFKLLFLVLLVVTSCKTKKNVAVNSIGMISTKKIISNHYKNNFTQQTINAKLSARYSGEKTSISTIIKLRLEKDKTIWMSATKLGFPLAKVKITPTNVSYYEKLSKTYFNGDFSLLSKWLGTELNFEKVQNILLGQAVLNLKKGKYNTEILNNSYQLKPKKDNELFSILFFLNPENFKLSKQEIRNPKANQFLSVSYSNYTKINGEQFPKKIDIKVLDNKKLTNIAIQYKTVSFNQKLTFPFSIPVGYKEIIIK